MPKKHKKASPDTPPKVRQYNLRFSPLQSARIDATAEALGLDPPQLLRMLVLEHLHEYEARAARIREAEQPKS